MKKSTSFVSAISLMLQISAALYVGWSPTIALASGGDVCTPDYANLVSYWKLDEATASETVTDSKGSNNGTPNGAAGTNNLPQPTTGATALPFLNDNGKNFDGTDDGIDLGSNVGSFAFGDSFSIAAWINPTLDGANHVIYGNAWTNAGYQFRITTANTLRFILIQNGSTYLGADSTVLSSGWQHVTATWDGATLKIYVDGTDVTAGALTSGTVTTITTAAHTYIGQTPEAGFENYFTGDMDDVRIYDNDLSAAQVARLAAGRCGAEKLQPSIDLASDNNPSIIGETVTFTATLSDGYAPSGTVTFKEGAVTLGTGTVTSGVATYATGSLSVGTHNITATYNGDIENESVTSSPVLAQVVDQSPTSSVNLSSANPSIVGQSVTFNATITGVSPTGNVTFFSGAVLLGTGSITTTTSTGAYASFSTSDLGVGTYSITARYNGDTNNEVSSSNTINVHVVNQSPTSTVNLSAPNPSYYGDSVTFTATIAGFNPTGDVDFFSGATLLGNASVFGATATGAYATFSIATLAVGTNDIHAVYNGDTNNLVSTSNTVNMHVVDKSPTSSVNLSAPNPSTIGETVTFDATITGVSPTGTVSFFSGATLLGTVAISTTVSTGAYASFGTSSLPVGTHSVTAIYNGDGNNEISASNTVNVHVVNQFISTTIAFSGPTPTTVGTTVTFTATVYGYGNPTGIVTFYDNASAIGTGALIASGTGSEATFMTNALTVGNHNITGTYEGDINNTSGTSTAPIFVQVIDKSATVTTLVSSENPINLGGTVTFSVSVTGYFPTGTVRLTSNDTEIATGPLNASGTVTFDLSSFSAGTFTIVAHYLGDGNNYASDSDPLNQIVIGGVNGGMRRFRNLVRYLNGESNAGFGDVGLPFGAFGGPGPGGGTGELTADQLITMCSIHDKIIFLGALNVVDYMAEIYSHTFDVEEGIIADILRNGTDCSTGEETTGDEEASADASSLVTMDPKYTVTFPVAEDGYPLSSDQIWNVCIRNYQVFIAGEVKPINCNRYHEGHTWEHPDLHITFKWSDRFVKQIKVRGMQVATITVPTPKYIVQRSMETTNLNSLVGLANLAKKTLNFTDLLGSVQ